MGRLNEKQTVYCRSMGKLLRVTAIFTSTSGCNKWLEKNSDHGVIAVFGASIFCANLYDHGSALEATQHNGATHKPGG